MYSKITRKFLMAIESVPYLSAEGYGDFDDDFIDEDMMDDFSTEDYCGNEWIQSEIMHNYSCVLFNDIQYFIKGLNADEENNKYEISIKTLEENEQISKNYGSVYELLEFLDFYGENDISVVIIDKNDHIVQDITNEDFRTRVA